MDQAVLVFGPDAAAVQAAVEALRSGGATVAGFVGDDESEASAMGEDLFPGRQLRLVRAGAS